MRWAAFVVVLAALVGCGATSDGPEPAEPATETLSGVVLIRGEGRWYNDVMTQAAGRPCRGGSGLTDINVGAQVTIRVGAETVALGELGAGESTGRGCEIPFTVDDVPTGHDFYTVEVGREEHGDVDFRRSDFEEAGWEIELTI